MWEVHRIFNLFPRRSRQLSRKRAFGLPPCGPRARTPACPSYGLEDGAAAHYAAPSFKLTPSLQPITAPTGGGRHG
jgi:hypothetical protein